MHNVRESTRFPDGPRCMLRVVVPVPVENGRRRATSSLIYSYGSSIATSPSARSVKSTPIHECGVGGEGDRVFVSSNAEGWVVPVELAPEGADRAHHSVY